jgi:hypothetical protein
MGMNNQGLFYEALPNAPHPIGDFALSLYERRNRISSADLIAIEDRMPVGDRNELYHALQTLEVVAILLYVRLNPPSAERIRSLVRGKADEFKDLQGEFAREKTLDEADAVNLSYQKLASQEGLSRQAPMVDGPRPSTKTLSLKDLRPRTTVAG